MYRWSVLSRRWRDGRWSLLRGRIVRGLRLPRANRRLVREDVSQKRKEVEQSRLIPILCPLRQIGMVHPSITAYMLAWSHKHVLVRIDVYNGRLARVGVGHPYGYREAVRRAAKRDGQRPAEVEQEVRGSILVC